MMKLSKLLLLIGVLLGMCVGSSVALTLDNIEKNMTWETTRKTINRNSSRIEIAAVGGHASNWWQYAAQGTVDLAANTLTNVGPAYLLGSLDVVNNITSQGSLAVVNNITSQGSLAVVSNITSRGGQAFGTAVGALGSGCKAYSLDSFAIGQNCVATNIVAFACGISTRASGHSSSAFGGNTIASGSASMAQGYATKASGLYSHAEGENTWASGYRSHAQGYGTRAGGDSSWAGGGMATSLYNQCWIYNGDAAPDIYDNTPFVTTRAGQWSGWFSGGFRFYGGDLADFDGDVLVQGNQTNEGDVVMLGDLNMLSNLTLGATSSIKIGANVYIAVAGAAVYGTTNTAGDVVLANNSIAHASKSYVRIQDEEAGGRIVVQSTDNIEFRVSANGATTPMTLHSNGNVTVHQDLTVDGTINDVTMSDVVTKVGTPVDNQVGVWTGDGTLEGDSGLTWDGTNIVVIGGAEIRGAISAIPLAGAGLISIKRLADSNTHTITGGDGGDSDSLIFASSGGSSDFVFKPGGTTERVRIESMGLRLSGHLTVSGNQTNAGTLTVVGTINGVTMSDVVTKAGTPVDNQVGVWTGDGTLEGLSDFVRTATSVCIGTNAPIDAEALSVYEADAKYTARFEGAFFGGVQVVGGGNTDAVIQFISDGVQVCKFGWDASDDVFKLIAGDGPFSGSMFVIDDDTGNVGIGTNNPSAKLDVVGDTELNGALTVSGNQTNVGNLVVGGTVDVGRVEPATGALELRSVDSYVHVQSAAAQNLYLDSGADILFRDVDDSFAVRMRLSTPDAMLTLYGPLIVPSVTNTGDMVVQGDLSVNTLTGLSGSVGDMLRHDGTNWVAVGVRLGNIGASSDAVDVSGLDTLQLDTTGGDITLGGFTNGIVGQIIRIFKVSSANNLILEFNEASGAEKFILTTGADETRAGHGGWILYRHSNGFWYSVQ